MPAHTVNHLINALNKFERPVKNTKIALLGLSYKPNLGDLRESPALKIKQLLKDKEADLVCYDPFVPDLSDVNSLESALKDRFAIVLATAHKEFSVLTGKFLSQFGIKIVIDGRNFLDKDDIMNYGIYYKGIGR